MAYITRSSVLHTRSTYLAFTATIDSVPFFGPDYLEPAFRKQLRAFLVHILHCMFYSRTKERFYNRSVPVSHTLGRKKFPLIFIPEKKLGFKRGLESLKELGILDWLPHDRKTGRCREFTLSVDTIRAWFGKQSPKISKVKRQEQRVYNLLHSPRGQRPVDIGQMIARAIEKGASRPRHDLSGLRGKATAEARQRYMRLLNSLEPNRINLSRLLDHLEQYEIISRDTSVPEHRWLANVSRYMNVLNSLRSILECGVNVISHNPLIVEYYPRYKVAAVGGRMFEVGGGFQTLPGKIKWDIFECGANYDLVSSQLNILRGELHAQGIKCSFLNRYPRVERVAEQMGIPKATAKILLYGTIFSAGRIKASSRCSIYRTLQDNYGTAKANAIFSRWRTVSKSLCVALKQLAGSYIRNTRRHRHGWTWTNAAGTRYHAKELTAKTHRKVLAHMIQGIESEYVLRLLECTTVYALEHDGVVSEKPGTVEYKGLRLDTKNAIRPRHTNTNPNPTTTKTITTGTTGTTTTTTTPTLTLTHRNTTGTNTTGTGLELNHRRPPTTGPTTRPPHYTHHHHSTFSVAKPTHGYFRGRHFIPVYWYPTSCKAGFKRKYDSRQKVCHIQNGAGNWRPLRASA